MMRLRCYKACFGCVDVVAICWTKGDKLVPPGAMVGNLASGCGIICIPDLINVMIIITWWMRGRMARAYMGMARGSP